MISNRTKMSLCQYLELQDIPNLCLLLEKYGLNSWLVPSQKTDILKNSILSASAEQLFNILDEVIKTGGDLRSRISPRYRHDERWENLTRSLQLDGYKVEERNLVIIEPTIENFEPIEDDLTKELKLSALAQVDEIIAMIEKSSEAYRQTPPDHNECLVKARIALETLAREIARKWQSHHLGNFKEDKWGEILAYLHKANFITKKEEEEVLAGVYGFVSAGAHAPIVDSANEEMTRLGRNLVISMCYFFVKRYSLMMARVVAS